MRLDSPTALGTASGFGVPTGGSASQILQKVDNTNYNTQWVTSYSLPAGGTDGQVLLKTGATAGLATWTTGGTIPTGGTAGFVLAKKSGSNYDTEWVTGSSVPTYIQSSVGGGQVFTSGSQTTVTGWSNFSAQNAGEWNAATGVFTATKAGWYSVSASITFASVIDTVNTEYAVGIIKNGVVVSNARIFVQIGQTTATFKHPGPARAIVQLSVGDTMGVYGGQFSGSDRTLHSNGNSVSIQELPNRIIK